MSSVRHPAVAGRFYPRDPESLREEVNSYLKKDDSLQAASAAIGCIAPHAGYMYSGHVAGAVFARIKIPQRCIVMCPNHTGIGRPLAIMSDGEWEMPLGNVKIDSALAASLKEHCPALQEDASAHHGEHAAEVELPFLLLHQPKLTFVPIALGTQDLDTLEQLGLAIAEVVAAQKDPVLIVASSDMNHYESDVVTRAKDQWAIERILTLDARGLHEVVTQRDISMCGMGPAVTMLTATTKLGAKSAELVKYATSGDISGDRDMVVGYAGVVVR
ncbi:MAG TPA: AmmeMemoRadiSam system protein B [Candidatus Sulfotelmatobacter sp.]|nr:AmmeMemoRadiSam system protein B [Candidatus Sulfotelmatobacter sp.]